MATTPHAGEVLCPDPSAHDHSKKPSDSASRAALLATGALGPDRKSTPTDNLFSDDGKLSSKNAAQSLKYAQAQDLPSFPSRGATPNAAFAAANLAKDHTMKELWQPEASVAGMRAATKAQKDGGHLDLWEPSPSSAGNSAAVLAMRTKGLSPEIDRGYTDTGKSNSLVAATMSHHTGRQRAGSLPAVTPANYPDSQNSTKNALNAAVASSRTPSKMAPDGWDSEANQAARIKNLGGRMDPQMFTEHPQVGAEIEEQRHQAALRASAVSMAKSMYERSATPTDSTGLTGAETAHRRNQSSTSQADLKEEAMKYIHLQDAAHKIAQERLAKLDKEMSENRYREYYGYGDTSPKKSRYSIRRKSRAASEGEDLSDSDDERQARRIRSQMSQLSSAQNTVDLKQRSVDRAKLMAAAEKRVHARMHDMDEKVFQETGKVSPAMMEEWEAKARVKAEQQKQERELAAPPAGKIAIGGGKFMDKAEIEAIAAARLKPTLDEIDDTAAKMRARDAEMKRQQDAQETAVMEEKMSQDRQKAEFKRIKEQDKAAARKEKIEREKAEYAAKLEQRTKEEQQRAESNRIREEEKAAARKEKEERKAAERKAKEDARVRKSEEKRKSREAEKEADATYAAGAALEEVAVKVKDEKELAEAQDREAVVAGGAALGEIANKVKQDQEKEEEERKASIERASVALGEIAGRVKIDREEEEKQKFKERERSSAAAAAGGDTLAEIAERVKQDRAIDEGEQEGGQSAVVAVGAAGAAGVAGVAAYAVLDRQDTGPAPNTIGPHESDLANILDPRVKPDPALQKAKTTDPTTGPAPNTIGPHSSDLANIVDPRVRPDPALQKERTTDPETGPAPNTIGPYKSDLANIIDPRVQPDPELQKGKGKERETVTEGPHQSGLANFLDPGVDSQPKTTGEGKEEPRSAADEIYGAVISAPTDIGIQDQIGTTREEPTTSTNKGLISQQGTTQEDPKRKSSGRGVFGRIKEKLKKREDDPRAAEPVKAKQEPKQSETGVAMAALPTKEEDPTEKAAIDEEADEDDDIDRSKAAEALIGVGAVGGVGIATAAAAASPKHEEEVARSEVSSLSTEREDEDGEIEHYTTSVEHSGDHVFATPTPDETRKRVNLERHISTIDSGSESDDLEDSDDEDDLEDRGRPRDVTETTTAPAAVEGRESGEAQESSEYGAYDRAGQGRIATEGELENKFATYDLNDPNPERTEEMKEQIRKVEEEKAELHAQEDEQSKGIEESKNTGVQESSAEWGAYERAGKGGTATEGELENRFATYDLNDPNPERTEELKERIRKLEEEKAEMYGTTAEQPKEKEGLLHRILHPSRPKEEGAEATDTTVVEEQPRSAVSPVQQEEVPVIATHTASANDPHLIVADREAPAAAPASAIKTSPSEEESSQAQSQKERKGIRGLFSKLTSKPEQKLSKGGQEGSASVAESIKSEDEGSFAGGAKLTGGDEKDGVVSPVTTTSTGIAEQEGKTDGTVGDIYGAAVVGSSARDASPSSFKRHEAEAGDLDDVSSSGAEEDDVQRGRAGRLAQKLGIKKPKGKEKSTLDVEADKSVANAGGEEQTEEARDEFDESLAPPPAFAGQVKNESHSPARETRFQEQF